MLLLEPWELARTRGMLNRRKLKNEKMGVGTEGDEVGKRRCKHSVGTCDETNADVNLSDTPDV